ncbi:hypothetical protein VE03_06611 [Pseudogymnoascus sp. 23342-1-I1]|nr:hypothetical protein VE03_06611 [Pseudogymnoascus sp. 23342-1-I1]
MACEPSPRRALLPMLKRRPHATRRPTQGEGGGAGAAASWSSMPESTVRPVSDEMVSGRLHPMCYYGGDMPNPLLPVPSASFEIVSAMPECLESRERETSLDLDAWVENTNRHTHQAGGGVVDEELVPWMQLPQPEFSGISKDQYRDTPLYSAHGSPDLSRAYVTKEVACPQPRPPIVSWASWATFGFGESYAGLETLASLKRGASPVSRIWDDISYYGDASGEDRASVSSPQSSSLSIKCQGRDILELPPLTFGQPAAQPVEESLLPGSHGSDFMDWAENGGSGRSSPCYSECAYEVGNQLSSDGLSINACQEFATPLAPARARIVHISGDYSQFPSRSTSLFQRGSSESSPARVPMDEASPPNLRPASPETPNRSPISRPRPFTPYPHYDISTHTPPLTPVTLLPPTRAPPAPPAPPAAPTPPTPLFDIYSSLPLRLRQRKHIWGSSASEMSSEILNDIYAATRGSSIKKLSLEYPCVIVIRNARRRWRTYDGWYTSPAAAQERLGSLATSMFLSSGEQSPVPSLGPSLAPPSEVGSKDTEHEAVWSQGEVTGTVTPVTDLESEAGDGGGEGERERLPEADLGALRRIFPRSGAKWYGILYAHIVCYNYVMDLERGPTFQHLEVEAGRREAEDESVRYGLILRNLEYCISRIICRMRGKNGRRADRKAGSELRESHLVLTRSLSTFVRSCEASIM